MRFDLDVNSISVKIIPFFKIMLSSILIVLFLTFGAKIMKILPNFDILLFLVQSIMAFPYLIGPGGQPFIIQQVPLIQQQVSVIPQQQVLPQQTQSVPSKVPDYMSEEKLQEKGTHCDISQLCGDILLLFIN